MKTTLLFLLFVQGCAVVTDARIARSQYICERIGYKPDTDLMRDCIVKVGAQPVVVGR